MTILSILIFLHVLAAIIWVGGAITIHILMSGAKRVGDPALLAGRLGEMHFIGQKIFAPVSLLLFILGFAILGLEKVSPLSQIWLMAGVAGFAFSFVVGFFYLGPESGKLAAEYEAGKRPVDRLTRLAMTARVELLILLVIVFLMVTKPF